MENDFISGARNFDDLTETLLTNEDFDIIGFDTAYRELRRAIFKQGGYTVLIR